MEGKAKQSRAQPARRFIAGAAQIALDLTVLSAAYWLAFALRFEFDFSNDLALRLLLPTWPYVVIFQYVVLAMFDVPRFSWRHVSMREAQSVLLAMIVSVGVLVALRLGLHWMADYTQVRFVLIPLGVLGMDFVLAFLGVVGVRAIRRLMVENREQRELMPTDLVKRPTLLVGAGKAGALVARELKARPDLGVDPVAFIDDDAMAQGSRIHGIPVVGSTSHLKRIVERSGVENALITIANASGPQMRRITTLCREAGLQTQIVPGLHEIVAGKLNLREIRDVAIEDLLGRDPVQLDSEAICDVVRHRVVMVTGAGGSIGAELCRQICRFEPSRLVLVEQAENPLFEIHRSLVQAFPGVSIVPRVADICDRVRMDGIFSAEEPDAVFHAAAHKHVPMMEWNPREAVLNNVLGTRVLANAADAHGVEAFVMISTDKAVNPSSVMGATKRVAEIYVQALSQTSDTRFVAVRFGNVLGSTGSVIPTFRQQIAEGGPVTVTDPEMRRYFMTISEACQLVLQAGAMGDSGEIMILDMGDPVRIVDLARDLITLSGLRPDHDIEIAFTGMRPGEKLFEELSVDAENAARTGHPKIFVGRIAPHDLASTVRGLDRLEAIVDSGSEQGLREELAKLVPEYRQRRTREPERKAEVIRLERA